MKNELDIFMDESGKTKNEISLIGAISIPKDYYHKKEIKDINQKLKNKDFNLHFTKYNPRDKSLYKEVFDVFLNCAEVIDVNIMAYKISNFRIHPLLSNQIRDMIYEKVPERVIYGLLRKQSDLKSLKANVYVEDFTEYRARSLNNQIKKQVNSHALYRFNDFKIKKAVLVPKNTEIGVEFTDLVIGIIRFIMLNTPILKEDGNVSKTLLNKYKLIDELLPKINEFLVNINLFELSQQDHLDKIPFANYLRFFKAHLNKLKEENYINK